MGDPQVPYTSIKITNIYQKTQWSDWHLKQRNLTNIDCVTIRGSSVLEECASNFKAQVSHISKVAGSREVGKAVPVTGRRGL
jgi:hypothetical protein